MVKLSGLACEERTKKARSNKPGLFLRYDSVARLLVLFGLADRLDNFGSIAQDIAPPFKAEYLPSDLLLWEAHFLFSNNYSDKVPQPADFRLFGTLRFLLLSPRNHL